MRRRHSPHTPHRRDWGIPVVMSTLAVGALLALSTIAVEPILADVHEIGAPNDNGLVEARIAWLDTRSTPADTRTEVVRVPLEYIVDDVLPIWPTSGEQGPVLHFQDPRVSLTPLRIGIAAGFGALLGLVVLLSLRGYGYVRGTGEIGSMNAEEVREDRGFYWRS